MSLISFGFAQQEPAKEKKHIQKDWEEAMEEMHRALDKIEIPEIDLDSIMNIVEETMPSRKQMDSLKEVMEDTLEEIEKIDMSFLDEIFKNLEQVFDEMEHELHNSKNKAKVKKI